MPPKAGPSIWQDAAFLGDLALALYEAAHRAGGLSPLVKAAVEDTLRKQGHETSWEAIRQHVQKLRKGRDMSGIGKAAGGSTPTKASPAKAGTRQKKTPSKRSHKAFVDGGGDDDDDDDEVKNLKESLDAEAKPKFPKTTRVKREESPDLASNGSGNEF